MNAKSIGLAIFLAATASTSAMAATPDPAAAPISTTLDQLHAAAARADGKAYFSLYTPDAVFMGTDVAERWPIADFKAYAEPIFARGQGWTYTVRERHVTVAPTPCRCIAWFDEVLDSEKYGTSRGTGVVVLGEGGWKIAQYALTFPMPNELAGEMTRRIRDHEKNAGPK